MFELFHFSIQIISNTCTVDVQCPELLRIRKHLVINCTETQNYGVETFDKYD